MHLSTVLEHPGERCGARAPSERARAPRGPLSPSRADNRIRSPRSAASGRWEHVDKGSRQNGSVTSGKGLALRAGPEDPRAAAPPDDVGCSRLFGRLCLWRPAGSPVEASPVRRATSGVKQPAQNWHGQRESDCLIKTKHCEAPRGRSHNVISAQCSECQHEEIQSSAGKRRE